MKTQQADDLVLEDPRATGPGTNRSRTMLLLESMRLTQWLKNGFVLGPLAFSGKLLEPKAVGSALAAFVLFCLVSGGVYLLNDVVDRERDALHPKKRGRPIASGRLSHRLGTAVAALLWLAGLSGGWFLGSGFALVLAGYGLINIAYSFKLKHVLLVDALTVASGFVLRVVGGSLAIGVVSSEWLLLCTLLLALFLALAKRKYEAVLLEADASGHREILDQYGREFLDQILSITAGATLVFYSLYTFFSPVGQQHPTLMLTIPFVLYGIYRYMYLIHQLGEGGSPEELVLRDRGLLLAIMGWILATLFIFYLG